MSRARFSPLGLDRAGLLAMLFRGLPVVTGPITVLVIAASFGLELQGYFFTFLSILTAQTLLEMGLGAALQQVASHEWAALRFDEDGRVAGEEDARTRLAAVARFGLRWYAAAACVAVVGFAVGGVVFFGHAEGSGEVAWRSPWLVLSLLAGANLFLTPGLAILEGCNQVKEVYSFRVVQGVCARACLWVAMLSGLGLWALAIERAIYALFTVSFYLRRYAAFFASLFSGPTLRPGFWKHEIWPLQWRVGVVWISGFVPSLFIPTLFLLQGPEEAARLGMTWKMATALVVVAYALVGSRMPRMAIHIARGEFAELDRLFGASLRTSILIVLLGSAAFVGGLELLIALDVPLANRFLGIPPTVLLLGALFLQQLRHILGTYLRAHKREPYVALSLVEALLTAALLYPLGREHGALGLTLGFLVVAALIFVPAVAIFRRCRARWHQSPDVSGR